MKIIKKILIAILVIFPLYILTAQVPPHPNGGGGPGAGNIPVGGGAPIGSGMIFLVTMGMAYGVKKWSGNK